MNNFAVQEGSLILEQETRITDVSETDKWVLDKLNDPEDKRGDRLRSFLALQEPGDELKSWSWQPGPLCGRGGLCIVRNGKPVYAYPIWMS